MGTYPRTAHGKRRVHSPLGDMFLPWLLLSFSWVVGIVSISEEWAAPLNTLLLIILTGYTARLHTQVRHRKDDRRNDRRKPPGRRKRD